MAEKNDRNRILSMLSEKKITVEEAEKLLAALDDNKTTQPAEPVVKPNRKRPKKVRILVDTGEKDGDSAKVNLNIPVSLIRTMGPMLAKKIPDNAKNKLEEKGVDIEEILNSIETMLDDAGENDFNEDIVNVDVGETDGDSVKVRIYFE